MNDEIEARTEQEEKEEEDEKVNGGDKVKQVQNRAKRAEANECEQDEKGGRGHFSRVRANTTDRESDK